MKNILKVGVLACGVLASTASFADRGGGGGGNINISNRDQVTAIVCRAQQPFNSSLMDGIGSLILNYKSGLIEKPASAGAASFGGCVAHYANGARSGVFQTLNYAHGYESQYLPGRSWNQVRRASMTMYGVGRYGRTPSAGYTQFAPIPVRGVANQYSNTVSLNFDDRAYGYSVAVDLVIELDYR